MLLEIRTAETENVRKIVIPIKSIHDQGFILLFAGNIYEITQSELRSSRQPKCKESQNVENEVRKDTIYHKEKRTPSYTQHTHNVLIRFIKKIAKPLV
jgi:hypothetical protein